MSKNIDERIVRMQFDNKQFESGVSETLSTLDKLKAALSFKGKNNVFSDLDSAAKKVDFSVLHDRINKLKAALSFKGKNDAFSDLDSAAKKVDFSALHDGIEKVSSKFSALEQIAVGALRKIGEQAVQTGEQLVKSLSIDQITAGWEKYNEATSNVQTLVNATGKSEEQIYKYLDKLMWYSDETSYGFTDMTSALSTMTSVGGDVEDLIPLLEGVANATAYAGKGAKEYSRIMQYAITQAYSAGSLTYMDWKTIQNAGVGSVQLQQALIDAGEELGTIEKGLVTTKKFAASIRADSAKDLGIDYKWITPEVMEKAFGSFAQVTEEIYKGVESGKFETYADGVEAIGDKYGEVALRAAKSAQEAKTLAEAIDATKDAVSSGWMKSFELMFGRYETATKRWTQLCNDELWEIFASSSEIRNEILQAWSDAGGSEKLWQGIINIFEAIKTVLEPLKNAFAEVFNFGSVKEGKNTLMQLTDGFLKFTKSLALSDTQASSLQKVCEALFSILKFGFKIIGGVLGIVGQILNSGIVSFITDIVLSLSKWTNGLLENINVQEVMAKVADFVLEKLDGLPQLLKQISTTFKCLVTDFGPTVESMFAFLKDKFGFITPVFDDFKEKIESVFDRTEKFKIETVFDALCETFEKVMNKIQPILNTIRNLITGMITDITTVISSTDMADTTNKLLTGGIIAGIVVYFETLSLRLSKAISTIIENFNSIPISIKNLVDSIKGISDSIGKISGNISGVLEETKSALKAWQAEIKADIILKIAAALGILAVSLKLLSTIETDKLSESFAAVTSLIAELVGALIILDAKLKTGSFTLNKNGITRTRDSINALLKIAASVLILAMAMKTIGSLDLDKSVLATIEIMGLMRMLIVFIDKVDTAKLSEVSGQIILIGISMVIFGEAIKKIGEMDIAEIGKGVLGLAGIFLVLAGALYLMPSSTDLIDTAKGLLVLGASIKIIVSAMETLGEMDEDSFLQAISGFALIMATLVGMVLICSALKNGNEMTKIGAGLLMVAVAMDALAIALKMLADVPSENLIAGAVALDLVLGAMMVIMNHLESGLKDAGALLIVAAGIDAIAIALKIISEIPSENLIAGAVALDLVLGAMMVVMNHLKGSLKNAASILIVAIAIDAIAAALAVLSLVDTMALGENLLLLAASLTAMIIAGYLAKPVILIILALAGAFLLWSVSSVILGAGLVAIASGITAMAGAFIAGCTAVSVAISTIITVIQTLIIAMFQTTQLIRTEIANTVISIISNTVNVICAMIGGLFDVISSIVSGFVQIIVDLITMIGSIDFDVLKNGLTGLAAALGIFIAAGYAAAPIAPVLLILAASLLMFGLALDTIVLAFGMAVGGLALLIKMFPKAKDVIVNAFKGIADGWSNFWKSIGDTITNIGTTIENFFYGIALAITNFEQGFISLGGNIITGLCNGILGGIDMLWQTVVRIAKGIISTFKEILGIHSPSTVFEGFGDNIDLGLANGITGGSGGVTDALSSLSDSMLSSFSSDSSSYFDVGSTLGDSLVSGLESSTSTATISPVVDMDDPSFADLGKTYSSNFTGSISDLSTKTPEVKTEQVHEYHVSFDTLKVQGVDNKRNFIAEANYAVDEIISTLLRKEARV